MSLDIDVVGLKGGRVFEANITHNLGEMATECGLYDVMWRPEEHGLTQCETAIPVLRKGVAELAGNRERYERFNPENGWGSYDILLRVATELLEACENIPCGTIRAMR